MSTAYTQNTMHVMKWTDPVTWHLYTDTLNDHISQLILIVRNIFSDIFEVRGLETITLR